jgi:hypothetical protein
VRPAVLLIVLAGIPHALRARGTVAALPIDAVVTILREHPVIP